MDTHMDTSMDIHMEMPIKSKVSKLGRVHVHEPSPQPPAPYGAEATTRVPKANEEGIGIMRKRSSKGGGEQRSIQVHLMVNEEEAGMIRTAAKKRNQTVSLTIIEAVKLLEGRLQVKEEERDSPTVQTLKEIEYQLRRSAATSTRSRTTRTGR